jgi:hypothetical protein
MEKCLVGFDLMIMANEQAPAKRIAVVALVGNHSQRPSFGTATASAGHRNLAQGAFGQRHFSRTRRLQLGSQRNTLAVDHHHPLCALALLGFSDADAPFLAGAKLPSRNASLQSRRAFWSSSERNCRQILSQVPSSSQRRKRRQHVLGLGYLSGRSFQRAPVRRIQRMPSKYEAIVSPGSPFAGTFRKQRFHAGPLPIREKHISHPQLFTYFLEFGAKKIKKTSRRDL